MQTRSDFELASQYQLILKEKGIEASSHYVEEVIKTIKERATFVNDFWELSSFYFVKPTTFDEKAAKKAWKEGTSEIMENIKVLLEGTEDFSQETLQENIKKWITDQEIGFGKVMQPLRLTMVGEMKGPDLFHIISSIGKKEAIKRIDFAIETLS
ncbi:hypothetical protein ACFSO9_12115 [Mesonia maritima]|uniref:hypothetical protein n=1 Tax=Mesonia maritima TaxID=1793873 RepID=UPI00363DAA29